MATRTRTQRDYETWEIVGKGAVWVTVSDDRGKETQRRIGKGGVARLRLKRQDREAMQDAYPGNPFDSGRLRRVDEGAPAVQKAKTDAQLVEILSSPSLEDDLMAASQLDVRRLRDLAEQSESDAVSVAQLFIINKVIDVRWPRQPAPSDQVAAASERFELA